MIKLKIPFKKQQFDAREEAIIDAVNHLLSDKGYDLMTMDDVADAVGIAKGSLYKHFSSKEKLAAAALTRLLKATLEELDTLPEDMPAIEKSGIFLPGHCVCVCKGRAASAIDKPGFAT
jgi:AcrR family transcriptional regulator